MLTAASKKFGQNVGIEAHTMTRPGEVEVFQVQDVLWIRFCNPETQISKEGSQKNS